MSVTTYIVGLVQGEGFSNQVLIPCITNGTLISSSNSTTASFLSPSNVQSDWSVSDTNSLSYIKNKPYIISPSQSSASRTLNTVFQLSTTRGALVNYAVDVSCTLSLTTGQSGTIFLEIASDSGFTANVQELTRFSNANSGTLTIGLNLVQSVTGTLSGYVPTNYYCRLRTSNVVGTPTFTYRSGQEILL